VLKDHFGHEAFDCIPIENEGGSGTGGSHWEELFFSYELMTGVTVYYSIFSKVTLAYLADMGIYELVNDIDNSPSGIFVYLKNIFSNSKTA